MIPKKKNFGSMCQKRTTSLSCSSKSTRGREPEWTHIKCLLFRAEGQLMVLMTSRGSHLFSFVFLQGFFFPVNLSNLYEQLHTASCMLSRENIFSYCKHNNTKSSFSHRSATDEPDELAIFFHV